MVPEIHIEFSRQRIRVNILMGTLALSADLEVVEPNYKKIYIYKMMFLTWDANSELTHNECNKNIFLMYKNLINPS